MASPAALPGGATGPCPLCGSPMVIKLARSGKFMSCERFPKCMGARKADGSVMEAYRAVNARFEDRAAKQGRAIGIVPVGEHVAD